MKTPQLETLIGVYYHQDFETVWGTLDDYLAHSAATERAELVDEIGGILVTLSNDAEIDRYLDSLGNCVDCSKEPGGYRGWLEEIARRVRAHLADA
ncbi:MAG: hypothetical protein CMJ44_08840 [Pimelobacter sp.]|nr:hypothetical protein [Pimelobacter sp.]